MNRKIKWNSYCFDEIELIYDKASEKDAIGNLLEELEELALKEAEYNCNLAMPQMEKMTKEQFTLISDNEKENLIFALSNIGLESFRADISTAMITVELSPLIPQVLGCTMFSVLNRLEKLDGAFNILANSECNLQIVVPLGCRKGLAKWEMLIVLLYPWLSVKESPKGQIINEPKKETVVPTDIPKKDVNVVENDEKEGEESEGKVGLIGKLIFLSIILFVFKSYIIRY